MNRIIDRLLILGCCLLSLAGGSHNTAAVVALLAAVTVSSLNGLTDSRFFVRASTLLYALLTLFLPGLLFFFPLILYDLFLSGRRDGGEKLVLILVAAVLVVAGLGLPPGTVLSLGLFTAVAHVLAKRTRSVRDSDGQLRRVQDQSREITLQLQGKNEELIARRDQAAHLARLAERGGRIAREIHDHVGHLLPAPFCRLAPYWWR